MFGLILVLLPVFEGAEPVLAEDQPKVENLQLLGRSALGEHQVGLVEADWNWLHKKGALCLGVSAPDYPPFDLAGNGRYYEGLTADFAGLLAQLLRIQVQVRRYPSRADVIRALKEGVL